MALMHAARLLVGVEHLLIIAVLAAKSGLAIAAPLHQLRPTLSLPPIILVAQALKTHAVLMRAAVPLDIVESLTTFA